MRGPTGGVEVNSIRYDDYVISKGRLRGTGHWESVPIDFVGFYDKLMSVRANEDLLKFAREHGFLGYQNFRSGRHGRASRLGQFDAKKWTERMIKDGPQSNGEPIEWVFAHSRTMLKIFHTVTLLKEYRNDRQHQRLSEIRAMWKSGPFALRGELRPVSVLHRLPFFRQATNQWGLAVIDEFLGGNIRGVYPRLLFAVDGRTEIDFEFRAPIEGAYFHLLQDITVSKLKICKFCQRIFRATDPRSEHCCPQHRQRWATRNYRAKNR